MDTGSLVKKHSGPSVSLPMLHKYSFHFLVLSLTQEDATQYLRQDGQDPKTVNNLQPSPPTHSILSKQMLLPSRVHFHSKMGTGSIPFFKGKKIKVPNAAHYFNQNEEKRRNKETVLHAIEKFDIIN